MTLGGFRDQKTPLRARLGWGTVPSWGTDGLCGAQSQRAGQDRSLPLLERALFSGTHLEREASSGLSPGKVSADENLDKEHPLRVIPVDAALGLLVAVKHPSPVATALVSPGSGERLGPRRALAGAVAPHSPSAPLGRPVLYVMQGTKSAKESKKCKKAIKNRFNIVRKMQNFQ